jgi:2-(1,2-epoxy-1,2-dihydrophenyl)acetyl-CoA isomerase
MRLNVEDGVAELWLDRPDSRNALDPGMVAELGRAVASLSGRDDLRAVLLAGEGSSFCVGGDVRFFAAAADPGAAVGDLAAHLHVALAELDGLEVPVVARLQGATAGAGLSLACAADIAIAAHSATFVVAYSGVGLSPDGGASWRLPRLIGPRQAIDLMLSNRSVDATEAVSIGLVTEAVPDDELDRRTEAVLRELAQGPTGAFAAIKRLLRAGVGSGLHEHLDLEAAEIEALAGGPSGREGFAAFVERRKPDFRAGETTKEGAAR